MASIHQEIVLAVSPEAVWDAVRDIGAIHTRLAPGFVVNTELEPGARLVTFANGLTARELIVDLDDGKRRLAWAIVGGRMSHHNASLQVFSAGAGATRAVWIADLLPDDLRDTIAGMIAAGLQAMKLHLEASSGVAPA